MEKRLYIQPAIRVMNLRVRQQFLIGSNEQTQSTATRQSYGAATESIWD